MRFFCVFVDDDGRRGERRRESGSRGWRRVVIYTVEASQVR